MNRFNKLKNYYRRNVYPKVKDRRGATRLLNIFQDLSELGIEKYNGNPRPVDSMEWDNLIILDACRYDTFVDVFGAASKRVSVGSATGIYVRKTFSKGDYSDWVYVSSNPHFSSQKFSELTGRKPSNVFHSVFQTFRTDWDNEFGTVKADPVVRDTLTAAKLFPDKKLVAHFMQPHIPFVDYGFNVPTDAYKAWRDIGEEGLELKDAFTLVHEGVLDRETVRKAYRSNLEYVKPFVKQLVDRLDGATLVTSDHGNFLGENDLYGHPGGTDAAVVREVPCLFVRDGESLEKAIERLKG